MKRNPEHRGISGIVEQTADQGEKPIIRMRLIFSGRVQGVGFRHSACWSANEYGLSGSVCNKPAGTVSCEVQRLRFDIDAFIRRMSETWKMDLTDIEAEEIPPVREEIVFSYPPQLNSFRKMNDRMRTECSPEELISALRLFIAWEMFDQDFL